MRQDELQAGGPLTAEALGYRAVETARVRKKPRSDENDNEDDEHEQPGDPDNEAPETPTDEPAPVPIRDPPSHDAPKPPLTVRTL